MCLGPSLKDQSKYKFSKWDTLQMNLNWKDPFPDLVDIKLTQNTNLTSKVIFICNQIAPDT